MSDPVQQIKDRLNIVDVVSAYVELHKAGRHFKGKSPFTNEKTPSFYVSPDRGMYYCFSTSQGGDMFTFIQTMDGVDFKEALKILAEKANVELVPVSPQRKSERDRLYAVMEAATVFYVSKLGTAPSMKKYLTDRGLNETSLKSWRIGFAPGPPESGWTIVKEHLLAKGFTDSEILKAGLSKLSDKGKEPYDVFRNRIMFPLFDQNGHVVGFSGRTTEAGSDIPKYVNSPETELYKKSELLFGYDKAKKGIRNLDFSLIVEGQFDVVMSHQAGYNNTVAVSGTALTLFHVQLLERLSKKVVLALDGDKAGLAAVKRAAELMLKRGLDVKVAALTGGMDPADLVLKDSKEYKKAIGKSTHVIEFLLESLQREVRDERTFKLRSRDEVIPYLLLLPNHIDQDYFEGRLADKLKTTKEAIHYEVERLSEQKKRIPENNTEIVSSDISTAKLKSVDPQTRQRSLLTYLLGSVSLLPVLVQAVIINILEEVTQKKKNELDDLIAAPEQAEVLFRNEAFLDKNPRRIFEDEFIHSLNQLRETVVRQNLKIARYKLEEAEKLGETDKVKMAVEAVTMLQKTLQSKPYTRILLQGD